MGKFHASYNLVKLAFKIINKEKELLVYSLLSGIATILILISYYAFIFGFDFQFKVQNPESLEFQLFTLGTTFIYYLVLTFIALFFNTAILTSVNRIIRGEENTFWQGISSAFKNIGSIIVWSFISAVVSTILKFIQDKLGGWLGKFVVAIIGGAWNLATFFALPIMVLEKKNTKDALKTSVNMFKSGWGDMVVTNITTSFFFVIITLVLFLVSGSIMYFAYTISNLVLGIFGGIILASGFVFVLLLSSTTNYVLQTLLYVYIKNDSLPEYIDLEILKTMFKEQESNKL